MTCTSAADALAEPLAATAAHARTWLLLEQPGPWGAKALTESRLDPALGALLESAGAPHGVRVALIRSTGRHAATEAPRRAFLAHTAPGASWVRTTTLASPHRLTALDFAALGAGRHEGLWEPRTTAAPLALVCTNGRRDLCCARLGRPHAEELSATADAEVWEVSHLGGHRFAPTLLVLPYGYAYGRATADSARRVLAAARRGRVLGEGCRGRSAWDRTGQAADLALRSHLGEEREDAVDVLETGDDGTRWTATVEHACGERWLVHGATGQGAPSPASCGSVPEPGVRQEVLRIEPQARSGEPTPTAV
ncbi:sucrase ferredoxin [Streptomyces xiaopingdaonensis]|uniref:sucrase ferredoxin n=1 Tax=Streptomyces xiaopingdaonensis TaxID=1565415 RepID=UPI00036EB2BA